MSTLENIKNRLIDRILTKKNEKLLSTIESMFDTNEKTQKLSFDSYQMEMLHMSEKDIENGDLISESDLEAQDSEWMN
jgi:hypothetical protein